MATMGPKDFMKLLLNLYAHIYDFNRYVLSEMINEIVETYVNSNWAIKNYFGLFIAGSVA